MYHQFKELADVDITKEPMEIGPTCHYVMGGVEVDPDTELSGVAGLYAVGECSGGMHGSNRLGGNSLSDLIVFGKRAGEAAAAYAVRALRAGPRSTATCDAAEQAALAPFDPKGDENPYTIQADLQQSMNDLVGIIRTADELEQSLKEIEALKERAKQLVVRWPGLQPGLAHLDRHPQHAAGLGVHREGGAGPPGVARWPHPRRLPRPEPGVGREEPRAHAQRGRRRRGPGREAAPRHARRAQSLLRGQVRTMAR